MTGLLRRVGAGAPLFLVLMLGAAATLLPLTAIAPAATPAVSPERGFELLTTKPYLTPDFDDEVFERLHTCWEPEARDAAAQASPAERRKLTLARYGLTEHPDGPRATALQYTPAAAGGWAMNCMACHTGKVAGYVVEGHVPVAAVQRLLAERPAIHGLAVPGMPLGSPGMEIEGEPAEPFDVITFAGDGTRTVYTTVRP